MMNTGVGFYLVIYLVYYLSFKLQLHQLGIEKTTRAAMAGNPLDKLSFFFSGPAPKAFSLNLLYHTRSAAVQVFAPVMMGLFAISVYIRYKNSGWKKNTIRIIAFLVLMGLVYLPSMLVKENFSSYRTMLPFSLTAGMVILIQLFWFVRKAIAARVTGPLLAAGMAVTGYLNFNSAFVKPVVHEHQALKEFVHRSFNRKTETILFIRADRQVFRRMFGTHPVKDEFGYASTARDWVPDPLVRQLVMEETGDRATAAGLVIRQFADHKDFEQSGLLPDSASLLVDMDSLIIHAATPASGF